MTDNWEYYPCQVDDKTAFIFYDHGISESIDELDINEFLLLKVPLRTDNGSGLPKEVEFDSLSVIDDLIEDLVETYKGHYVGRVTVSGACFFHCYMNIAEEQVVDFITLIYEKTGYRSEYLIEVDEEKEHYWADLYPSEEDLQVMKDLKTMATLADSGDDLNVARRIDHWIYFSSEEKMKEFMEWAEKEGFSIDSSGQAEEALHDHPYFLKLYNIERPVPEEVSETTAKLVKKAEELEGEYEGWDPGIVTDEMKQIV